MKLVIKINDTEYVLTPEQTDTLTKVLFNAEVSQREYLGSNVPEAERWVNYIAPATETTGAVLRCDIMDDEKYEALVAVGKMRKDAKK